MAKAYRIPGEDEMFDVHDEGEFLRKLIDACCVEMEKADEADKPRIFMTAFSHCMTFQIRALASQLKAGKQ